MFSMAFPLMARKYSDCLVIVGISFASAWICEGISWILIYRTANYKSLRSTIDRTSKKLETMKSSSSSAPTSSSSSSFSSSSSLSSAAVTAGGKSSKSKSKKMDRFENSLKESSRDLSFSKFKSGGVVAIVLIVIFGFLNSLFEGKAVARLPFRPVPLIQRMSHRGLPGDDPTDCAMVFLYFLCSVSIRTNLQKLLGFAPPRAAANAGLFAVPESKTK